MKTPLQLVRILLSNPDHPVLLVCDHAGFMVPEPLGSLGLSPDILQQHIGWDIGAARVTEAVAQRLGCGAILGVYSRLVADLNRDPKEQSFVAEVSDGIIIPGNQNLSAEEREERRALFHEPWHQAIQGALCAIERNHRKALLVAIHSFTPQLHHHVLRPWHVGIMWKHDPVTAHACKTYLAKNTEWVVGDNQPYSMFTDSCYTIARHGERMARPSLFVEIRQDTLGNQDAIEQYADVFAGFLKEYRTDLETL